MTFSGHVGVGVQVLDWALFKNLCDRYQLNPNMKYLKRCISSITDTRLVLGSDHNKTEFGLGFNN